MSAAQILGDDSLLLKYLNPHLIVVITGLAGPVAAAGERAVIDAHARAVLPAIGAPGAASSDASPAAPLTVRLIDGVTGRVLHVQRHAGASGPVSLVRHEHWVVCTYWNARLRRPEVATMALFEGALEK